MKRTITEYHYSVTMGNGEGFDIVTTKPISSGKLNKICKDKGSVCKTTVYVTESHTYELADDKFIELANRLD